MAVTTASASAVRHHGVVAARGRRRRGERAQESHDAWLDFGSARLVDGDLMASGVLPAPPRDALVDATERVVRDELATVGGDAVATVEVAWSPRAGMWFVEVEPKAPGAARVSIGIMGDEFVVSLPNSHWEIWRSTKGSDPLRLLADDAEAVFTGRVEEGGVRADRPVRLVHADGRVRSVGVVRLPIPWRWRRRTKYRPYGSFLPGSG